MVIPFTGSFNGDKLPESLYDWVMSQPEEVQSDLFSSSELQSIKETGKFKATTALNLEQYQDKISKLLK